MPRRQSSKRRPAPQKQTTDDSRLSAGKGISIPTWLSGDRLLWVAVGMYVLVCAIISFVFWTVGGYGVETDALGGYLPETRNLLNGTFTVLDGFKGPGYHLAVAGIGIVVRDLFSAAKIVALVSAGLVLVILHRLVARHLGRAAAWIALVVVATNAQFVLYTIQVGTDLYFLALALGTAALLIERRTAKWALVAGALAGLAYLTRYNGLFLILAGVPIHLLSERDHLPWNERIVRTAAFLLTAFAVIVPWSLFTWSEGYGFFFNQNYLNVAYEMYGRDTVSWDQFWEYFGPAFTSFGEVVGRAPGRFLTMIFTNGFEHFRLDLTRVLVAGGGSWVLTVGIMWGILILGGLALVIGRHRWSAWQPVLVGLFSYGILVPVFYGERFSLPMLPVYAALVAAGVVLAARMERLNYLLRFAPAALLVMALWTGVSVTGASVKRLLESSPEEVGLVAQTVGKRLREGERVLARKPHVAYHLGLEYERIPFLRSIRELPDVARSRHTRYLFVSGIEAQLRRPLIPLLDPRNAPDFLRPIAATTGVPAVLYEFTIDIPPKPPTEPPALQPAREEKIPQAVRLGMAYLKSGRTDLAREHFQSALSTNPDEPTAKLGFLRIEEAQAESVLRNRDSPVPARTTALDQLQRVADRLEALAAEYPDSRQVQLAAGDLLVRRNRHADAIPYYRRASELNPDDALNVGVLGDLQRTTEQYADAEVSYRRLLERRPDDPEAHRALAQVLTALNRIPEALDHLKTAFDADTASVQTQAALARAYSAAGDSTRARPHWEYVLRETEPGDPLNVEASFGLGLDPMRPHTTR